MISIRKYEAGMMKPRLQQLQRISDALEINVFLLQEEPYPRLRMETEEDVEAVIRYLLNLSGIENENELMISLFSNRK